MTSSCVYINIYCWYWPLSKILPCTSLISHNAPLGNISVHICAHFCHTVVWCIVRFVKWEYLSVARQGTIQTVRVSSWDTSIYVKQLIILIITAIQSHFYISRFVCWSLQMTYNRRNISLKVFEKNGSTSDIFMATFILFGHQFIIIWQSCPILFAADRLPGSTKDCLIPQWKMIISCCLSLRFDWVTLQIYYIIWNFIFTPQDCCCNHMNLSLKEIQVCCVIVYI